ncbi:MAG TPA: hypothetical protein VKB39_09575 [Candidatus Baltobacteraceae bacterium]|nr:hypothetical protein [Candidatus Baltobacteraceae bacterium]
MHRWGAAIAFLALAACSSQSPEEAAQSQELATLSPLKQKYQDVVMGFDFKPAQTLIVSLDLQNYNGMGDDDQAAMKKTVVATWRNAWQQAHPGQHATTHLKFIDFIGRTVGSEDVKT